MGITVYTQNGCHFCDLMKDFLTKNQIEHTEKNISQNREYYSESLKLGAQGVPFTVINNENYAGFNEVAKKAILNFTK